METEPGVPSDSATGPAARVGDGPTRSCKRTVHMFAGSDYSIVLPGISPHNPAAQAFGTRREWLTFDYEAGWGTDAFEESVPDGYAFPPRWAEPDDRYDGLDILRGNLDLFAEMGGQRGRLRGPATSSARSSSTGPAVTALHSGSSSGTAPTATPYRPASTPSGWPGCTVTVSDAAGTVVSSSPGAVTLTGGVQRCAGVLD